MISKNHRKIIYSNIYCSGNFLFLIVFLFILLIFSPAIYAQVPANPLSPAAKTKGSDSQDETRPAPGVLKEGQTIKDEIERLQKNLTDSRRSLYSEKAALGSSTPEQLGATDEEVQQRMRMLIRRVHLYDQHIGAYLTLNETRRASKDLTADAKGWQGFDKPSPYPISLVDGLRNEIYARKLEIEEERVKQLLAEGYLEEAREFLKETEKRLRKVSEDMEKPPVNVNQVRLKWLYNLAQIENEVSRIQVVTAETQRQVINEGLTYQNEYMAFLDRKLKVAVADVLFTKEELDRKLESIEKERSGLESELRKAKRDDMRRQERLEEAREDVSHAREKLVSEGEDTPLITEEIKYLQHVVNVRKAWTDTTSLILRGLKLFMYGINAEQLIWEDRYRLATTGKNAELKNALQELDKDTEKVRGWLTFFESNLRLTRDLVLNEKNRISKLSAQGRDRPLVLETIKAYEKRIAFLERGLLRANEIKRVLGSWKEEITERQRQLSFKEHLSNYFATVFKFTENVWNFELFAAEDTIIVDGQKIAERRPVTVSKVVRAVLVLIIGLWISSLLARLIRSIIVKYFKVEPSTAGIVKNLFYGILFVSIVLFALITVKIPLTVFTFLGGALAIGVGFGAQNVINNFLSGIILLIERPIKVGDIVEVDETRARVIRIGGRCSQVKRFDGIDVLVPNSSFLEKDVVNWTLSDNLLRIKVSVGVAYGSPTSEVSRLITSIVDEHGKVLKHPKPVILFEDFGDSSLVFTVYFWIEITPEMDFRIVASDIRHMLDKRLREAGITIAFPQRDVHLDSSRPIEVQIIEKDK